LTRSAYTQTVLKRVSPTLAYVSAALAFAASLPTAYAQRASENAVTTAQDAFGTSIGNDSIGLYSSTEARGFSPKDAGNMRIEGLYYDQHGNFGYGNLISRSTTIRVGLSAQSYPFPAPTGIADVRLRLPGNQTLVSVSSVYGPYASTYGGQIDLEAPLVANKLGAVVSGAAALDAERHHGVYFFRPA
jgi:iron complex outermembrane recepter protein